MPLPASAFPIDLNFTGGLSASQEAIFEDAARTWESHITGYQPGIVRTGISIDIEGVIMDGLCGLLGSAGIDAAKSEFDPAATFVPVEQQGGGGITDPSLL